MATHLMLGVDGGKSKTVCVIADETGRILGWGRAGSSDKYYVPLEKALDEISASVQQALHTAGLKAADIQAACFGLAGDDWPEDNQELCTGLTERGLARSIMVKNDAQIALRANIAGGAGVIVCAGTHLAAAIRTPQKEEWHSAWFSVQGMGGVSAGEKILWSVLHACDGRGEQTALTGLLLPIMGVKNPLDLLRMLSTGKISDADLASFTPLVFKAHNEYGDAVAAKIIMEMGQDMARWVTGLMGRYGLLTAHFPVILTGGIFHSQGSLLVDALSVGVHQHAPWAEIRLARVEPVIGAVAYAFELAGLSVSSELITALQNNLPGAEFFRTDL